MKISGAVIQNRNIRIYSEKCFRATYKGYDICVSTNHNLGEPIYKHLKRYGIGVWRIGSEHAIVDTYEDLHTMRDAIREALIGAHLIKDWRR